MLSSDAPAFTAEIAESKKLFLFSSCLVQAALLESAEAS
jgi:hypothetical protein